MPGELEGAGRTQAAVLLIEKRFHTSRHRFAGVLFEHWLGIEQIDLTGAPVLEQQDHPFGAGRKLRRSRFHIAAEAQGVGHCRGGVTDEVGETEPTEAGDALPTTLTPRDVGGLAGMRVCPCSKHGPSLIEVA